MRGEVLMTAEQQVLELDKPLREALSTQKSYLKKLKDIVIMLEEDGLLDETHSTHLYRLVLQHRLDKESVIKNILLANKQLCLALGVEEHGSLKQNTDALVTQLGTDTFFKELSLLSHLVDKLNRALSLLEETKKVQEKEKELFKRLLEKMKRLFSKKEGITLDNPSKEIRLENVHSFEEKVALFGDSIAHELSFAAGLQAYFSLSIEQLTEAYHAWAGAPKFGVVYDYLAGLKGPFSELTKNIKEGIALTDQILQKLSLKLGIAPQKTVNQLFNQTNAELITFYNKQKALIHDHALYKKNLEDMNNQLSAAASHQMEAVAPNPQPKPPIASKSDSAEELGWKRRAYNLFNRS